MLVRLDDIPRQRFFFPLHEVTEWLTNKDDVAKDFSVSETYQLQKEFGVNFSDTSTDKDYVANAIQPQVSDLLAGAIVANTGDTQDDPHTTTSRPAADVTLTPGLPSPIGLDSKLPSSRQPSTMGPSASRPHALHGGVIVPNEEELLDDFDDDEPGSGAVTVTQAR